MCRLLRRPPWPSPTTLLSRSSGPKTVSRQCEAQECQSEGTAIRRAEGMSRDPANAGAVAFKRAGDPNVGEFSDAVVLKMFGDVPEDLSEL